MSYNNLIAQNISPLQATKIGVYDSNNKKVGKIELGNLKKTLGNKLYSFGLISDIHLSYDTAEDDFKKALQYFENTEDVDFVCITGDLTVNGRETEFQTYKTIKDTYSPNTPVYPILGNHDSWSWLNGNTGLSEETIKSYTGQPLFYSFEKGNDLFVFVGCNRYTTGILFSTEEMQWLYEILEQNRNKRIFLFHHVRPDDACGNAYGIYATDIWGGTEATVMESLFRHYKNITMFHGHSHLTLALQTKDNLANYDKVFGINSIHVPSLAVPRVGDASGASSRQEVYAKSEGYIVDVYEDGIVLRGRDFVADKFFSIATYYIQTPLTTIDAKTYTDSTGTIDTSDTYKITNNLSNATNSNTAISVVKNGSYQATISPNTNYAIESITVTMNGEDITSSAVNGNDISITSVTGDIIITVTTISTLKPCTSISLDKSTLSFTSTETQTLVATVTPSDTTDTVAWESSDESVATVSNGVVTPKSVENGSCTITARCGNQVATCTVTVNISEYKLLSTNWEVGNISSSTGANSSSTVNARTDFIPINTSKSYYFTNVYTTPSVTIANSPVTVKAVCIFAYDSNKNFLQRVTGTDGNYYHRCKTRTDITNKLTSISNIAYVRIRIETADTGGITETHYDAVKLEEK